MYKAWAPVTPCRKHLFLHGFIKLLMKDRSIKFNINFTMG